MIEKTLNLFELSAILYYADYLSMTELSLPVTDTCKYFFIYGYPMNAAFIGDLKPFYSTENKFYKDSLSLYLLLKEKFGEAGVLSFLDNICNLQASGSVNGELMLKFIHRYSTKRERANAFKKYNLYKSNLKYTHVVATENGPEIQECSKYVAHAETKRLRK